MVPCTCFVSDYVKDAKVGGASRRFLGRHLQFLAVGLVANERCNDVQPTALRFVFRKIMALMAKSMHKSTGNR